MSLSDEFNDIKALDRKLWTGAAARLCLKSCPEEHRAAIESITKCMKHIFSDLREIITNMDQSRLKASIYFQENMPEAAARDVFSFAKWLANDGEPKGIALYEDSTLLNLKQYCTILSEQTPALPTTTKFLLCEAFESQSIQMFVFMNKAIAIENAGADVQTNNISARPKRP